MLDRTEALQSVDVLAEILDSVHVESAEARVLEVQPSLKCADGESSGIVIVVVRAGRLRCEIDGEQLELVEGDALALLHGANEVS